MANVNPTGVTEIAVIVGAVTVRVVDLVTLPSFAEIVLDPVATAVSKPFTSILAVAVDDEVQATRVVRSRLLPSL
jgi:hypothetical protein